jgi:hypothetical protein
LEARVVESENENAVNERYINDIVNSNRKALSESMNHSYVVAPDDTPKRDGKYLIGSHLNFGL